MLQSLHPRPYSLARSERSDGRTAAMSVRTADWVDDLSKERASHLRSTLSRVKNLDEVIPDIGKTITAYSFQDYRANVLHFESNGTYCIGIRHVQTYVSFALMDIGELNEIVTFFEERERVLSTFVGPSFLLAIKTLKAELEFRNLDTAKISELIERAEKKPRTTAKPRYGEPLKWSSSSISRSPSPVYHEFVSKNRPNQETIGLSSVEAMVQSEVARFLDMAEGLEISIPEEVDPKVVERELSSFVDVQFDVKTTSSDRIPLSRSEEGTAIQALGHFIGLVRILLDSPEITSVDRIFEKIEGIHPESSRERVIQNVLSRILLQEKREAILRVLPPISQCSENVETVEVTPKTIEPSTSIRETADIRETAELPKFPIFPKNWENFSSQQLQAFLVESVEMRNRLETVEREISKVVASRNPNPETPDSSINSRLRENRRIFVEALNSPFWSENTTLRSRIPEILALKRGFWSYFFRMLIELSQELQKSGKLEKGLPKKQACLAYFLIGETSITKERFLRLFAEELGVKEIIEKLG